VNGLYPKYQVQKIHDPENRHIDCEFFVLDLRHDPAARFAARGYATFISKENPELAKDIRNMVKEIESE